MNTSRIEDILPLSPLQRGLLFHATYVGGAVDVYTVQLAVDLVGRLDIPALRSACAAVLRRHPNLRAGFMYENLSEPVQVVPHEVELPWSEVDLAALSKEEVDAECARSTEEERSRRFDMSKPPLLRFTLLHLGAERFRFVLTAHHILLDGWSLPLLVRELFTMYVNAGDGGLPAVAPYRDYLAWLVGQDQEAAKQAWCRALEGMDGPTLVCGSDRSRVASPPDRVMAELSESLTSSVTALARRYDVTVNTVVQATWALLLSALTGRGDVVFGATVSGRPPDVAGVESMIGLFINTIPVRVRWDPNETFGSALSRLQQEQSNLMAHQHVNLADIQRSLGFDQLFDTLVVFQNYPIDSVISRTRIGSVRVTGTQGHDVGHYPLALTAVPGDRLWLQLGYRTDLFDRQTSETLITRFRRLLEVVTDEPGTPFGRIELLTEQERDQLVGSGTGVTRTDTNTTVPEMFERQVARTPDAVAVRGEDIELSYAELNDRAQRLAAKLRNRGVGPERLVAVYLPRSVEMVVVLLAVLKAGAAYVPIDPEWPDERVRWMLGDADPSLVVTSDVVGSEAAINGRAVLSIDDEDPPEFGGGSAPYRGDGSPPLPAHPAYVLYTSGSTGRPKGVVVTQHNLANQLLWLADRHPTGPGDRVLWRTSASFDAATWEIWLPLVTGALSCVADSSVANDPERLASFIRDSGVTVAQFTPSLLRLVLEPLSQVDGSALRRILSGGEALSAGLARRVVSEIGVEIINLYGPTETTVQVSSHRWQRTDGSAGGVPLGRPVWNARLYVLDQCLRHVPHNGVGELYVGGLPVSRGYLRRAGATAARFVADHHGPPGSRMYCTGDLVRLRLDGNLEYLGRTDDQVKIRGQRVEPGEIETVLGDLPEISEAAVVAREDTSGRQQLVGYLVPRDDDQVDVTAVRTRLAGMLPEHLVPAAFVVLQSLPLSPAGKVDRRSLPAPESSVEQETREPGTESERIVRDLARELLGVATFGVDHDFFEAGGDSILSIQLVSRARKAGVLFTPRDVFEQRTVARLAGVTRKLEATVLEDPADGIGAVPLTPVMHALRERGGPIEDLNQWTVLQVPPDLGEDRLRQAVQAIVDQHDMLRARLRRRPMEWNLEVRPRGVVRAEQAVRRVDISEVEPAVVPEVVLREIETARAELDPSAGVLLRVVWLDAGPGAAGRLLVMIHHLAVDGVSWRILQSDLGAAWQAVTNGLRPELEPVGTSFRTWARRLVDESRRPNRIEELSYWTDALSAPNQMLGERALDPASDGPDTGRSTSMQLSVERTRSLLATVSTGTQAGAGEVLLTALVLALGWWRADRGGTTAVVDVERHGREDIGDQVDLSRTVGWFTSAYPVRLELDGVRFGEAISGGAAAGLALRLVTERLREVPGNGLGFGMLRYLDPATGEKLRAAGSAPVLFNYLGRFSGDTAEDQAVSTAWTPAPELPALQQTVPASRLAPTHVLELNVAAHETAEGPRISAVWTWAGTVLSEGDVLELSEIWTRALDGLIAYTNGSPKDRVDTLVPTLESMPRDEIDELEAELNRDGESI